MIAALLLAATHAPSQPAPKPPTERVATCGGFLEGATVDAGGHVWAVDVLGGRLIEVVDGGQCVTRSRINGHPNGAKVASDGRLTVAASSGLYTFDPAAKRLTRRSATFEGKEVVGFNDLSFDRDGGLYLTVPGTSDMLHPDGRVFHLRRGETELTLVAQGIAFPNGVAVTDDGKAVLVAEFAAKRILSVPPAGARGPTQIAYVFAYTRGGVGPDGIQVDAGGRVYAAILGTGRIAAFDADGTPLADATLPSAAGPLVTNLAITRDAMFVTEASKGEIWRIPLAR